MITFRYESNPSENLTDAEAPYIFGDSYGKVSIASIGSIRKEILTKGEIKSVRKISRSLG
jgi:hypothetical protein